MLSSIVISLSMNERIAFLSPNPYLSLKMLLLLGRLTGQVVEIESGEGAELSTNSCHPTVR